MRKKTIQESGFRWDGNYLAETVPARADAPGKPEYKTEVDAMLTRLSPSSRKLLRWAFGLGRPQLSLAQMAERLGGTRLEIKQAVDRAMNDARGE